MPILMQQHATTNMLHWYVLPAQQLLMVHHFTLPAALYLAVTVAAAVTAHIHFSCHGTCMLQLSCHMYAATWLDGNGRLCCY